MASSQQRGRQTEFGGSPVAFHDPALGVQQLHFHNILSTRSRSLSSVLSQETEVPVLKEKCQGFQMCFKITAIHKNLATYPLLSQYIEEEVEAQSTFVICRRNSFTLKWRKSSAFRQLIEKRRPTQEGISSRGKPSGAPLSGEPQSCRQGAPV